MAMAGALEAQESGKLASTGGWIKHNMPSRPCAVSLAYPTESGRDCYLQLMAMQPGKGEGCQ